MKYLIAVLFSFSTLFAFAQNEQVDSIAAINAEKQGNIMAKLLLARDFKAFTKYTYPPIVKMAGGDEKMIKLIKESLDLMETQGYTFTNFSVEKPTTIVHFNNTLQCTIIENIEIKVPKGRLISKAALIGVSCDNGQTWTFIDTHGSDLKTLQGTLAGLSDDLVIPQKEKPVFYED